MKTPSNPIIPQLPTAGGDRGKFDKGIQEVVSNLHRTVKTDLSRMANVAGGKRQTVLAGKLDTTVTPNVPSCLSINGSTIDIIATPEEPLVISAANGYDELGPNDVRCMMQRNVESAWSGFAQNQRYFLYIELDDKGKPSYGKTIIPPQYGVFNPHRHSLLHFEGDDTTYVFTDEFGHTWTRSGNAQIDTAQYQFGTASMILDGVDDDIVSDFNPLGRQRWTHEIWVRPTDGTLLQTIFRGYPAYSLVLCITASGYLQIYAAYGNSSSWNLCGGTGAAIGTHAFANNTWEHVALEQQYDEANDQWILKAYKGGVLECYSPTHTQPIGEFGEAVSQYFRIGRDAAGGNDFGGHMDEYRFTLGACRYGNDFTVPTAAFGTGDGDIHWFNIDRMEMNVGYPGSWTKKKRVFIGEVATAIDSTTIERLTIYQYQNRYISAPTRADANTQYSINHECGIPFEGGLRCNTVYGINDTMTSSKVGFHYGASGYGIYSQGHGAANYTQKESWRYLSYQTSSTYVFEWDTYSRWSPSVYMQWVITRDW